MVRLNMLMPGSFLPGHMAPLIPQISTQPEIRPQKQSSFLKKDFLQKKKTSKSFLQEVLPSTTASTARTERQEEPFSPADQEVLEAVLRGPVVSREEVMHAAVEGMVKERRLKVTYANGHVDYEQDWSAYDLEQEMQLAPNKQPPSNWAEITHHERLEWLAENHPHYFKQFYKLQDKLDKKTQDLMMKPFKEFGAGMGVEQTCKGLVQLGINTSPITEKLQEVSGGIDIGQIPELVEGGKLLVKGGERRRNP